MKNNILKLIAILIMVGPMTALADSVVIDDKEWRQVSDTIGVNYWQVVAVCDTTSGECSGSLNGVDVSGWTWASVYEVGDLFSALTPHPGGLYNLSVFDSVVLPWIDEWFALFEPTLDGYSYYYYTVYTLGLTRDGYAPHVQKAERAEWENYAWTDFTYLSNHSTQGVWLYRQASEPYPDSDGDGVDDPNDFCPDNTLFTESVPTVSLKPNHWALIDGDSVFDTTSKGKGKGPDKGYTIEKTAGCSCEQIIDAQGLGNGHIKFGCSISAMDDWVEFVNE